MTGPGMDEAAIVAWAVHPPDGHIYVPGDTPTSAGTERVARMVVDRNQGVGGEWQVVPLVVGPALDEAAVRADTLRVIAADLRAANPHEGKYAPEWHAAIRWAVERINLRRLIAEVGQ